MKKKINTNQILEELKSKVNELSTEEKETFRDHMLAFLLFGDQSQTDSLPAKEPLKGITDRERELIRKLAAQTEALYRTMNNRDDAAE